MLSFFKQNRIQSDSEWQNETRRRTRETVVERGKSFVIAIFLRVYLRTGLSRLVCGVATSTIDKTIDNCLELGFEVKQAPDWCCVTSHSRFLAIHLPLITPFAICPRSKLIWMRFKDFRASLQNIFANYSRVIMVVAYEKLFNPRSCKLIRKLRAGTRENAEEKQTWRIVASCDMKDDHENMEIMDLRVMLDALRFMIAEHNVNRELQRGPYGEAIPHDMCSRTIIDIVKSRFTSPLSPESPKKSVTGIISSLRS